MLIGAPTTNFLSCNLLASFTALVVMIGFALVANWIWFSLPEVLGSRLVDSLLQDAAKNPIAKMERKDFVFILFSLLGSLIAQGKLVIINGERGLFLLLVPQVEAFASL